MPNGRATTLFNKILKLNGKNATAIALNIKDEHVDYTMKNLPQSKVTRMIIEPEFQAQVIPYCDTLNERAKVRKLVGFVEVIDGKIHGYNLDVDIDELVENPEFYDDRMILRSDDVAGTALVWVEVDLELIPKIVE